MNSPYWVKNKKLLSTWYKWRDVIQLTLLAGGAGTVLACAGSSAVAGSSYKTEK